MTTRKLIYIAAPLFSDAERTFNLSVREAISRVADTFLPQEDGLLLADVLGSSTDRELIRSTIHRIYTQDTDAVRRCDILLLILDGRSVDEGAAFELGFAKAMGKVCVGLSTDPRRLLPSGHNPMLEGSLDRVFPSSHEFAEWVKAGAAASSC